MTTEYWVPSSDPIAASAARETLNRTVGSDVPPPDRFVDGSACFHYHLANRTSSNCVPDLVVVAVHGIQQGANTLQTLVRAILEASGIDCDAICVGYPSTPWHKGDNASIGRNLRTALAAFTIGRQFDPVKHSPPMIAFLNYSNGGLVCKHCLCAELAAEASEASDWTGVPLSDEALVTAASTRLIANVAVPHRGATWFFKLPSLLVYGLSCGWQGIRTAWYSWRQLGGRSTYERCGSFNLAAGTNTIFRDLGELGMRGTTRCAALESALLSTCRALRRKWFAAPPILEMRRTTDCVARARTPYGSAPDWYPRELWPDPLPGSHILYRLMHSGELSPEEEGGVIRAVATALERLAPRMERRSADSTSSVSRSLLATRAASRIIWLNAQVCRQLGINELIGGRSAPSASPAPSLPQRGVWNWLREALQRAPRDYPAGLRVLVDGSAMAGKSRALAAVARACAVEWLSSCAVQPSTIDAPYPVFFFDLRLLSLPSTDFANAEYLYAALIDAHHKYCQMRGLDVTDFREELEHLRTTRRLILIIDGADELLNAHPKVTPAQLAGALARLSEWRPGPPECGSTRHHVIVSIRSAKDDHVSQLVTSSFKRELMLAFGGIVQHVSVRPLNRDELHTEVFGDDDVAADRILNTIHPVFGGNVNIDDLMGSPPLVALLRRYHKERDADGLHPLTTHAAVLEFILTDRIRQEARAVQATLGDIAEVPLESLFCSILAVAARVQFGEAEFATHPQFTPQSLRACVSRLAPSWTNLQLADATYQTAITVLLRTDEQAAELARRALGCVCVHVAQGSTTMAAQGYYFAHDLYAKYLTARFYSVVLQAGCVSELGRFGYSPVITSLAGQIQGQWDVPSSLVEQAVERTVTTGNQFYLCNLLAAIAWNPLATMQPAARSALVAALSHPGVTPFSRAFILNGLAFRVQLAGAEATCVADRQAILTGSQQVFVREAERPCALVQPLIWGTLQLLGGSPSHFAMPRLVLDDVATALKDIRDLKAHEDRKLWSVQNSLCELAWMLCDSNMRRFRLIPSLHYLLILSVLLADGTATAEAAAVLGSFLGRDGLGQLQTATSAAAEELDAWLEEVFVDRARKLRPAVHTLCDQYIHAIRSLTGL